MARNLVRTFRLLVAPVALWLASLTPIHAQELFDGWGGFGLGGGGCDSCGTCEKGCQTHHCPPKLSHCMERPPRIHVKCGCPRPICNPCTQPGWGYYETCWRPWPWPPNYNHCQDLPPAATIALSGPNNAAFPGYSPGYGPGVGARDPRESMPMPRTVPTPSAPTMPPSTAPSAPTTPVMPRTQPMSPIPLPMPQTMPQTQPPIPGGGIESLFPAQPPTRPDTPPRGPGGY